jgi:hypothetical protein
LILKLSVTIEGTKGEKNLCMDIKHNQVVVNPNIGEAILKDIK